MDVSFLQTEEPVDQDVLIQQMMDTQNGLNTEYTDELNEIIALMKASLTLYLARTHPELTVPENGPHFQMMMSSFEDIAFLILELRDLNVKRQEYSEAVDQINSKTNSFERHPFRDDPIIFCREKLDILESIRSTVVEGIGAEKRLDYEFHQWKLSSRVEKLMDLIKKATDGDGGAVPGVGDFLGILRKGIYSSFLYMFELQNFTANRENWPLHKENEEKLLKWVARETDIWEVMERTARGDFIGTNEALIAVYAKWGMSTSDGAEEGEQIADPVPVPNHVDNDNSSVGCFGIPSLWASLKKFFNRSPTN